MCNVRDSDGFFLNLGRPWMGKENEIRSDGNVYNPLYHRAYLSPTPRDR